MPSTSRDGHDVARRGRQRDERLERAELDHLRLVVRRARIGRELHERVLAPLRAQPLARALVRREHRRRAAELDDHVGDRAALADRQGRDASAVELEDATHAAAHVAPPQQLEDHVLGLHPVRQPAAQLDADDQRRGELERVAGHRDRDLQPAAADREHAGRARRRRVRVRADEQLPGRGEALEVHVVADAVAGLGVPTP